jgi:ferredoxin
VTVAGDWSVVTDRTRCIGSGMCTVYAPGTFSQDEEAKVVVLDGGGDNLDTVRTAVEACPTRALQLIVDGRR